MLAFTLTACATPESTVMTPIGYRLIADGLGVAGSLQEVSFGRSEAGAVIALEKLAGPAMSIEINAACDAKQMKFSDGLVANFRGNSFEGWQMLDGQSAGLACAV